MEWLGERSGVTVSVCEVGCWPSRALAGVPAEAIAVFGVLGEQGGVPAWAGVLA